MEWWLFIAGDAFRWCLEDGSVLVYMCVYVSFAGCLYYLRRNQPSGTKAMTISVMY